MEIETGRRREVMEPELLQELIGELRLLRREASGYCFLFTVTGDDVESFERDIREGRMDSLQLKFQQHFVLLTEKVRITEERTGWKLDDLRMNYLVTKTSPTELVVYGRDKPVPEERKLKYESGMQTITTATTQPDTIGTWPPDESYPNKELVRERTRSELYPMGRNAVKLYVVNYGPGKIYVVSTTDGVAWNYSESILLEGDLNVFTNVYALAIRTDSANTKYRASEYHIETARISKSAMPTLQSEYQTEWDDLWEGDDLAPKQTTAHTAYIVPDGYRLLMKGGFASCDVGVIQRVWLCATPGLLGDFRFDYLGNMTFVPSAQIDGGSTLTYYFYNNHVKKCRGTISLIGVLERLTV